MAVDNLTVRPSVFFVIPADLEFRVCTGGPHDPVWLSTEY